MECLEKNIIDTCVTFIYNGPNKLFFTVKSYTSVTLDSADICQVKI